ncbi:hypothetical protein FDECE_3591 [Fusarium decemcellulare]|nr:hypothetical protein FDECE_3591 [Fusarium decemcellulare]
MLPSRGIVRSLPSGALQRQLCSQSISSRTLGRKLGDARQFSTGLRNPRASLTTGSRIGVKGVAPVALGGISTARNFSLWPFGKKKTEEPVAEAATTTPEPITPAETVEATSTTVDDAAGIPADAVADVTKASTETVNPTDVDLTSIADLGSPNILNMEEGIGFLHAIGLDYGLGPTSVMQWVLEHVHVYSGFGWAGTIVTTALLLRVAMFYPQIKSLQFNAIMQEIRKDPRSNEAMECVKKGYATGDREMMQKGQFMNKMLRQEYNCSNWGMAWTFVQIPFSFGLFRVLNGMASIPVPSMESAGLLWFSDLTVSDPLFILPALGTGLLVSSLMINLKYSAPAQRDMMKKMMWVMGGVGFFGTTFLSAGVNLMMMSTGAATVVTALILNNETIRRAVGLPIPEIEKPKYTPPRVTQSSGVSGLRERLTDNLNEMKKGLSDQVTNYTGQYTGTEEERAEKKRMEQVRKLEDMRRKLERDEFEKKYKR